MMQTRTAGMENNYGIEQQRAAQAQAAQKEQAAAAVEAMLPSVVAAYSDPSDAGLDQAVALMPAEVRDTFAPFVSRLKTVRDPAARKAIIEAELAKDEAGRAVLDRVPTEIQRLNADVQRGQLDVSRQRLALDAAETGRPAAGDFTTVETAQGIFLFNKKTGELVPATAGAPAGEGPIDVEAPPQVLQPKPTAEKAEETKKRLADEKRAKDLDMAIAEVETVMKPGGLIDQSTGSYIGNLVDTAAAAVGVGTPGYIANAQLAPIADLVLKMVPRFEGPQSNLDVQSYKDAAGNLASPNVPNSVKMGAADTIVRLFKKYKGQFEYAPGEVGPEGGGNVIDFNDLGD
jgi:hypothetical protein